MSSSIAKSIATAIKSNKHFRSTISKFDCDEYTPSRKKRKVNTNDYRTLSLIQQQQQQQQQKRMKQQQKPPEVVWKSCMSSLVMRTDKITILLTLERQKVRSILETNADELPHSVINRINELRNDIDIAAGFGSLTCAAVRDFLAKVRTSLVDDIFDKDREQHRQLQQQQKRGLVKTVVHKDWKKIERQYETAFRFFPDVLQQKWLGFYPLQWITMRRMKDSDYNLRLVSLIPLIVKLGIELHLFDEAERGGLLSVYRGWYPLQVIIYYDRDKYTTNATDECYSVLLKQLLENNLFKKEDIQQYNLVKNSVATKEYGYFWESQFQYLIDWDPTTLSLPCNPENNNWLPIHYSTNHKDIRKFNSVLQAGMKYFPEKFGFVFCEGTRQHNGKVFRGTPFQWACTTYGQKYVMQEIMNHIAKYRSITASTTSIAAPSTTTTSTTATTTTSTTELSLLLSAVTDETIHIDCLYILMRNDPTAALLRLQQHLQQQLILI